eukprot:scaffold32088_cov62-Phaeocystis_antarctica.AAC.2
MQRRQPGLRLPQPPHVIVRQEHEGEEGAHRPEDHRARRQRQQRPQPPASELPALAVLSAAAASAAAAAVPPARLRRLFSALAARLLVHFRHRVDR